MINDPQIFRFDQNVQAALEFERLLKTKKSFHIEPGSVLERATLGTLSMLAEHDGTQVHDATVDYRPRWRETSALADLLRKVNYAWQSPAFPALWPHLQLVLGSSNISQTIASPVTDQDADKIFELYVGLLAARVAQNIEMDDPVRSSGGTNPDVMVEIGGRRWAFACKVMHSAKPAAMAAQIRSGAKQICRSDAEQGIVVISMRNLIDHDSFWPAEFDSATGEYQYPPQSSEAVGEKFFHFVKDLHVRTMAHFPEGGFSEMFADTKAVPGVLLHCSTTAGLIENGLRFPMLFRSLGFLCERTANIGEEAMAVGEMLNEALHDRMA